MAYNENIPQSTDLLSTSQPQIQGNFASILDAFDQNHDDFNGGSPGKHLFTEFLVNANSPPTNVPGGIPAGEVMLYSFVGAFSANAEMYINKSMGSGPLILQVPATASILSSNVNPGSPSSGWTFLPSGILLKWGQAQASNINPPTVITFPASASIPVFRQIFSMQLTVYDTDNSDVNAAVRLVGFSGTTNFSVWGSQRTTTNNFNTVFQWFAIGAAAGV
jgi:hypothetical protein